MKSLNHQFYAQIIEAMHANQITASDISAVNGHHYTYIYNTVRKNANVTLETAEKLAAGCGYDVQVTLVPRAAQHALTGTMDPKAPMFTARRGKKAPVVAEAKAETQVEATPAAPADPEAELDAEIAALLDSVDA